MRVENTNIADKEGNNENTDVVKSGDLSVTATPATDRKAIIGAISDLDTLKFKTSEEVTISKLVLERYGYSKGGDVDQVWLEDENGNEITARKAVNSRDQVELTFKKDYKVVDGSVNATIVVKLKDSVTTGGTVGFKVVSAVSTAKNQELDKSGYTPYTYDMVGYDAVKVRIDAKGNEKDYNYEEGTMYEVAKFKLKAGTSPLLVNGVTLTNDYGSGEKLDLKDFVDKVEVLANGEKVNGVKFSINKKTELVVSFDSVEVAAKENATFTVNISLAKFDQYGQGVKFVVDKESDVKIQEKKTGARVSVELPTKADWAAHKFVGSKIKLSNTKLGNVEYAAGSSDVVVASGTLTISEGVNLADGKFVVDAMYTTGKDVIESMTLVVAGEEFESERSSTTSGNNKFTFKDVEITKGGKVQIKVDLDRDAPEGSVITFSGAFDDKAFVDAEYPDGDDKKVRPDEVAGAISFATKLTVQASKASLSNDNKDGKEFKDNEISEELTVLKGKYTAKKGNIILSDFAIEAVNSGLSLSGNSTVTFYLYINGQSKADVKLSDGKIKGTDSFGNVKVKAGDSVDVEVKAVINAKNLIASGNTENNLGKFTVTLKGEDEEGNTAGEASRKTVDVTVVKAGSVVIADANTKKDKTILLAKGTDFELASFSIEPDGAKTELETLEFTLSGLAVTDDNLADKLDIEIDGTDIIEDDYCKVSGDKITCEGMSITVDSKKAVVITLDEEDDAQGTIEVKVNTLNKDTSVDKEFKKTFVNTLVRVSKQEFSRLDTTFTFSVDKKSSKDEAKELSIRAKVNGTCTEVYSGTDAIGNNSTVEFTNGTEAKEICKITYKDGSTPVNVDKETYADYFKNIPTVGGEKSSMALMINDNQK